LAPCRASLLSVLVWGHRTQLVDHRVKARAPGEEARHRAIASLFMQPAILLCLVYFALIAASTVGIQQFAVPAWTAMFGVTENYAASALIVFIVARRADAAGGGIFADRRYAVTIACNARLWWLARSPSRLPAPLFHRPCCFLSGADRPRRVASPIPSRDMIVRGPRPPAPRARCSASSIPASMSARS